MKYWISGMLGMALMVAVPACTDEHFDVQEGSEGDPLSNATLTLWQQLESAPDLSKFASIVERTPVFKDETHPIKGYTFKDVLNSNQVLTVFAPSNEAFTDAEMMEYENLLATRPYEVYLRLVGNHIATYNYVATGTGVEKITMINNKKATFDRANHKLKDLTLTQYNIPATNGTLHTLNAQSSFAYNIYEYLRKHRDDYPELNRWLTAHDTLRFYPEASAEAGADPETGEPIYVDSIYYRENSLYAKSYSRSGEDWEMLHKGLNADMEAEDSLWAFVLPSNAAWVAMKAKMDPWYKYAPEYLDMKKLDVINNAADETEAKKIYIRTIPDTIWKDAIDMDLVSPLSFNIRRQPRTSAHPGVWSAEEFHATRMSKMFNNRSDTFTVADRVKTTEDSEDVKSVLFGTGEPEIVSNGLIYPVNSWNFYDTYGAQDVEVKVDYESIYQSGRYNLSTAQQNDKKVYTYVGQYDRKAFNSATSKLAQKHGSVSKNYFFYICKEDGESQSSITLKLNDWERDHQIMSNIDYEIGLVLVPNYYYYGTDNYNDKAYGEYNPENLPIEDYDPDGSILKKYFRTDSIQVDFSWINLSGKEQKTNTKASRFFCCYQGENVDTVWVHHDKATENGVINFPASYKNLRYAYPTITITALKNNDTRKRGHVPYFGIDRVILKAKKD